MDSKKQDEPNESSESIEIEITDDMYSFMKGAKAMLYIENPMDFFNCLRDMYNDEIDYPFLSIIYYVFKKLDGLYDQPMKENAFLIFNYLDNYFRTKGNSYDELELINELKVFVNGNQVNLDKLLEDIILDLVNRGFEKKEVVKMFKYPVQSVYDFSKEFRIMDFSLLFTHISTLQRDGFNVFVNNLESREINYFRCIQLLLKEYPKLIDNKMFVCRTNEVIKKLSNKDLSAYPKSDRKEYQKQLTLCNECFKGNTKK